MNVEYEKGQGVKIHLSGDDVATAIDSYLVSHGFRVCGPRTISVNGRLCECGLVYVDPSGFAIINGSRFDGRTA